MRDRGWLLPALVLLGIAVIAAAWYWTRPTPVQVSAPPAEIPDLGGPDAPGPYLTIDVAGDGEGTVVIDLFAEIAPGHAERITELATRGSYNDVVFHRVIDGFMAQTGDVENGKLGSDMRRAGTGGSDLPDLPAEFSDAVSFERGVVGMARSQDPNSANSQFFIMFAPAPHLDGLYTPVGRVVEGMDVVDAIKKGDGPNGAVIGEPDRMVTVSTSD